MADPPKNPVKPGSRPVVSLGGSAPTKAAQAERRARALRENLLKRKAQARDRPPVDDKDDNKK